MEDFKYSVKLRDKDIKYRKWKGKDRRKFINTMIETEDYIKATFDLVYDCLEDQKIALPEQEFKYVLTHMRSTSIDENISFNILCEKCNKDFVNEFKIVDLLKAVYSDYTDIKTNNCNIKIGDIRNREYYIKKIKECESPIDIYMVDFLFHVEEFNEDLSLTLENIESILDDLDTDELDEIFDAWDKIKFNIDDSNLVKCTHEDCGHEVKYKFDEFVEFFPDTWMVRT